MFHGHHVVTLLPSESHWHNMEVLPGSGFIHVILQNKGNKRYDILLWTCFYYSGAFGPCFASNVLLYDWKAVLQLRLQN